MGGTHGTGAHGGGCSRGWGGAHGDGGTHGGGGHSHDWGAHGGCSDAGLTWAAQTPRGAALAEERGQVVGRHPALGAGAQVPHAPARGRVRARPGAGEGHVGRGSYQRPSSPSCTSSTSSPLLRASASGTPFSSSLATVYLPGTWGGTAGHPMHHGPQLGGASWARRTLGLTGPLRARPAPLGPRARHPAPGDRGPRCPLPGSHLRARNKLGLGLVFHPQEGAPVPRLHSLPGGQRLTRRRPAPLWMELPSSVDSRRGGRPAGARGLQPHVTELCGGCAARRGGGQSRARAPLLTGGQHRPPSLGTLPRPALARGSPSRPPATLRAAGTPQACLPAEAPPLNPGVLAGSAHPQASSGRAARPPETPPASLHPRPSAPSFSGVLCVLQTAGVTGQR